MDDRRYLLGLDAGNTIIKAVLFDFDGRQLATHMLASQTHSPAPGRFERDLDEFWANARDAIRRCIDKAGISADQIIGIGCAGHGNGLYLLDKADAPLLGIQSLDGRAADLAAELAADGNGDALHAICLQKPWPAQTPVLLAWVKRHAPGVYARAGTMLLCKDYLTFKLTGRRVSDLSDMSGCGLLRLLGSTYDDDLLARYGLADARAMLPDLIEPSAIAGVVTQAAAEATGLAVGTPVVAGLFDVIASAMGSGVVRSGEASLIAGTWNINQVLSDRPVVDADVFMVSAFGTNRFMNIESSATSAANLEWYVREFVERGGDHDDPFAFCNARVAGVSPALDDPLFHPYLYGSRLGAEMRAGFYGVAGWHTEGHFLRALFEGVVFEHRRHVDKLLQAGVEIDRVVLSGGGARSSVWPQMFADCLGRPIVIAACEETGALGAAIAAGVGAGAFDSYEAGTGKMTRVKETFLPDPTMKLHYDERYRVYLDLIDAMRGFWQHQNDLSRRGSGAAR